MTAGNQVISNMRRALGFICHQLLCWEWLGYLEQWSAIFRVTLPTLRQWEWGAHTGIWGYERWGFPLALDLTWMCEKDFSEKYQMRKHTGNVEEKSSCCHAAIEMLLNEHFNVDMLNLGLKKSLDLCSHQPSCKAATKRSWMRIPYSAIQIYHHLEAVGGILVLLELVSMAQQQWFV